VGDVCSLDRGFLDPLFVLMHQHGAQDGKWVLLEGDMQPMLKFPGSDLCCYLFIYLAADGRQALHRYCTVLAYGRTLDAAERIAINRVHQQGLRIVRADTATAAPWLDAANDADYLAELARYGSALRLSEAGTSGIVAPTA
jgi:hypothetical protein